MAAVRASQPNCTACLQEVSGPLAPHLCGACGSPQPKGEGESFFSALSAPERFEQDLNSVQKRFYELSRALHPDRFARSAPALKQASLDRMSFLNEAFEFLKSPEQIREHFYSKFGVSCGGGGGLMMMELSERWFEVQDSDDPQSINEFEGELLRKQEFLESRINGLEARFDALSDDATQRRAVIEEIQALGLSQNTLKSLIRDVQRLKARMGLG